MAQLAPAILSFPADPYVDARTGRTDEFDQNFRGERIFYYAGAIYAVYESYENTPTSRSYRVGKSTDNGATWTALDTANEPNYSFLVTYIDRTLIIGSRLYVIHDYATRSGSDYTYEIRIYSFDLDAELWDAGYVAGPSLTDLFADALPSIGACLRDACVRGTDEIVILYSVPDDVVGTKPDQIDIYNLTSATWTATGIVVFDGSGSFPVVSGVALIWDGDYVHIFGSRYPNTGFVQLHCTMDSSNALGTEQDLLSAWDAGWLDPTAGYSGGVASGERYQLVLHGSHIYAVVEGKVTDPFDSDNYQIYLWRCPIGVAVPTFEVEAVYLPLFATAGEVALNHLAFISEGALTVAWISQVNFDEPWEIKYSKRVGGSWATPATLYTYGTNKPTDPVVPGAPHVPPLNCPLGGFAAIANTPGQPARFSLMANIWFDYNSSLWYLTEGNTATAVGVRY
jgi:hypothetical protein